MADNQADSVFRRMLFDALDGRLIRVADREWLLEVFSVLKDAGSTWLQLSVTGSTSHTLMLKLSPHEGVTHVVRFLSSWLLDGSDTPRPGQVYGQPASDHIFVT